jgi:hypothetical protein
LGDLVLLTPALVLLSLSSHLHLHVSLRLSLLSLTALSLPLALPLPLPTTLTLSLCLYSLYFLLVADSLELATILLTGAVSLSQQVVWVGPAWAVVGMRTMFGGGSARMGV